MPEPAGQGQPAIDIYAEIAQEREHQLSQASDNYKAQYSLAVWHVLLTAGVGRAAEWHLEHAGHEPGSPEHTNWRAGLRARLIELAAAAVIAAATVWVRTGTDDADDAPSIPALILDDVRKQSADAQDRATELLTGPDDMMSLLSALGSEIGGLHDYVNSSGEIGARVFSIGCEQTAAFVVAIVGRLDRDDG